MRRMAEERGALRFPEAARALTGAPLQAGLKCAGCHRRLWPVRPPDQCLALSRTGHGEEIRKSPPGQEDGLGPELGPFLRSGPRASPYQENRRRVMRQD